MRVTPLSTTALHLLLAVACVLSLSHTGAAVGAGVMVVLGLRLWARRSVRPRRAPPRPGGVGALTGALTGASPRRR